FFFFSSRRRHTRSKRDWSSDVCSSDLFGIIGTTIESENPDVATAVIKNGFVTITSHAEGSTAIKVANGEDVATIDVTVDEFGNKIGRASCRERVYVSV